MSKFNHLTKWELPYWAGAVILSIASGLFFYLANKPWGLTTSLTRSLILLVEGSFTTEEVFNPGVWLVLGFVGGSFLSSTLAGQFRIRKIKSSKYALMAFGGGLLMGIGTILAGHCNVGSLFGAIPSFAFQGWIFIFFLFFGSWAGGKIIAKFLV